MCDKLKVVRVSGRLYFFNNGDVLINDRSKGFKNDYELILADSSVGVNISNHIKAINDTK